MPFFWNKVTWWSAGTWGSLCLYTKVKTGARLILNTPRTDRIVLASTNLLTHCSRLLNRSECPAQISEQWGDQHHHGGGAVLSPAVPRTPVCPRRRPHQRQPVLHQRRPPQQRHHPLPGGGVQEVCRLQLCCCPSSPACHQTVDVAARRLAGSSQAAQPLTEANSSQPEPQDVGRKKSFMMSVRGLQQLWL